MSSKNPLRAVIVDCFQKHHSTDLILTYTERLITSDGKFDNHVYFITSTSRHDAVSSNVKKIHVFNSCEVIGDTNEVSSFYRAKTILDRSEIQDVLLVSSAEKTKFWTKTCELLLTPVHQWAVKSVVGGEETWTSEKGSDDDGDHDDVEVKAANYLRSIEPIGKLNVMRSPLFEGDGFVHGFTTRNGGITTIPTLSSLNLLFTVKKRDPPIVIKENLRRVAADSGFDTEAFHLAKPEHGNVVWVKGKDEPFKYDGIVTDQKGVTIAAPGADCVPVIFGDPVKKICGAVHTGYRGTTMAAVSETVRAMVDNFHCDPRDIRVALGPALRPCCAVLKSSDALVSGFEAISPDCVNKISDAESTVDLFRANTLLLQREGILAEHIDETSAGICTCCHPQDFFSHHRDGFPFGNQIGFIGVL